MPNCSSLTSNESSNYSESTGAQPALSPLPASAPSVIYSPRGLMPGGRQLLWAGEGEVRENQTATKRMPKLRGSSGAFRSNPFRIQ